MSANSPEDTRKPLGIDVPRASALESPPGIAALFVIRFDIKAGYVISWKRSLSEVDIEGVVEYKSLPSGLHNVTEDIIYFVHERFAGISAFVNRPAAESDRNALMLAIGVLVPLSSGRLGKSWRHAPRLRELVEKYADDMSNLQPLEKYWETYQMRGAELSAPPDSPLDSPIGSRSKPYSERPQSLRRNRAISDAIVLEPARPALTPFHPASSLPDFVNSFGPLVFPLYRAALLRKRVLFMAEAPVQAPCNYVYDLSLLASLPQTLLPLLPSNLLPPLRPRPLFNVGIHDIPYLSTFIDAKTSPDQHPSWIACTTDNIMSMKSELYDVLVTLPPLYSKNAPDRVYPTIIIQHDRKDRAVSKSQNMEAISLKATQRDARRYATLRKGLRYLSLERSSSQSSEAEDGDSDAASTFSSSSIVEPLSWTRLAYTSFIWWASAGEKRDGLAEEEEEQAEQDTRLLDSIDSPPLYHGAPLPRRGTSLDDPTQQPPEVALVAYFRRWTTQIFVTLADAIARHDGDEEDADPAITPEPYEDEPDETQDGDDGDDDPATFAPPEEGTDTVPLLERQTPEQAELEQSENLNDNDPVKITTADMTDMGLDIWSATDRVFVEQLVLLWWGRRAYVDGARIRCCGIPIL
ncbi:hypothetical protein ASPZODRAFT_133418 [Penicilliopsis zonata CBS 506.65]|uniref:DUF4484 domain-containing protein n=1 Tax=Penicilliopsis zonata CBS 506.65 TaxID=1073090 RepID=A0A1L9SEH7_9EURO|nr:hypothetical protein ASPZODRAFT_133418 [Penicilliopsis zonata CBS 506.65]OJJ45579.1 hypothetical protein ASPZODRAFT_133418 [Penicilliopsis zonata CBS 506.65]